MTVHILYLKSVITYIKINSKCKVIEHHKHCFKSHKSLRW